jgi:hypothetical protein
LALSIRIPLEIHKDSRFEAKNNVTSRLYVVVALEPCPMDLVGMDGD